MMDERGYRTTCKANGCPLLATVVTDYWPREQKDEPYRPRWGLCRWHHETDPERWGRVTEVAKRHRHELLAIQHIESITGTTERPQTNETVTDWINRINLQATAEMTPPSTSTQATQALQRVKQILGV